MLECSDIILDLKTKLSTPKSDLRESIHSALKYDTSKKAFDFLYNECDFKSINDRPTYKSLFSIFVLNICARCSLDVIKHIPIKDIRDSSILKNFEFISEFIFKICNKKDLSNSVEIFEYFVSIGLNIDKKDKQGTHIFFRLIDKYLARQDTADEVQDKKRIDVTMKIWEKILKNNPQIIKYMDHNHETVLHHICSKTLKKIDFWLFHILATQENIEIKCNGSDAITLILNKSSYNFKTKLKIISILQKKGAYSHIENLIKVLQNRFETFF